MGYLGLLVTLRLKQSGR